MLDSFGTTREIPPRSYGLKAGLGSPQWALKLYSPVPCGSCCDNRGSWAEHVAAAAAAAAFPTTKKTGFYQENRG